jgi:hypothetical protein
VPTAYQPEPRELESDEDVVKMVDEASHRGVPYFRWHDSGDLQSVEHLARIVEVCERTPAVRHWLPTREYEMVSAFRAGGGELPSNLTVRLSAFFVDTEPVIPSDLADLPTSTVHTAGGRAVFTAAEKRGSIACRAIEARDNQCGPCRACWDRRVTNVSYPQH